MGDQPDKLKLLLRKDLGIAGTVVVLSQLITSFQSQQTVTERIDKLSETIQVMRLDVEQFFVRKTDLQNLSHKIDQLSEQVAHIKEHLDYSDAPPRCRK